MTGCQRYQHRHRARVGEIMRVGRTVYGRIGLIGDESEIACIPHQGCRLETWETAASTDPQVQKLLPLDIITYIQVRFLGIFCRDLFLLPNGREVKLRKLEGFKFRLLLEEVSRPPREEEILGQPAAKELEASLVG